MVIIDVPLLFESDLDKICDKTIGVIACRSTCLDRIMKRDGISKEKAEARISNQQEENFFKQKCDYCIFNDDEQGTNRQIQEILDGKNLSNANVIHVYDGDIEYLQFRRLLEFSDKLKHCYTLKPLDFGKNENYQNKKEEVLDDYKKICKSLDLNENNIYRPYQTHTNIVKKVDSELSGIFTKDFQNVDGLITDKKEKVLSLSLADCIALFFYDPVKNVIGNIHSGWQGTYKEISREAVKKLKEEYNCNPKDLICLISPSIGKCCFEVDEDVKDMFYNRFKNTEKIDEIIKKSEEKQKYYIDTVLINRIILKEEGLQDKNIIESGICTKCRNDKLHSHRKEGDRSGRNTAIISLI